MLVNGAYTERMCQMLARHKVNYQRLDFPWDHIPDAETVEVYLKAHPEVTIVSMVHNETTTGLLNDIASVAKGRFEQRCHARGGNPDVTYIPALNHRDDHIDLLLDEIKRALR